MRANEHDLNSLRGMIRRLQEENIKHAGEHVANLKGNRHSKDGVAVFGMWKGVRVGVIRTHGKIGTIFPDAKQPSTKGGKKK